MQASAQFCELLPSDEVDIPSLLTESEFFLPSDWSPSQITTDDILDGGKTPVCNSSDAFSASFFENSEAYSFFDLPLGIDTSSAYYTDLASGKDSPASSFSTDGSSPILKCSSVPWNIEDGSVVTVINPALIIKPEEVNQELPTIKHESEHNNDHLALTSQSLKSQTFFDQPPLDIISLQSYSVIDVPVPKVCRGRRVPTVEMVQKRTVKSIEFMDKKPGRDTFAERRFVCGYVDCRKCFKRREHLIRHQRSAHSSEKPFKCPVSDCFVSCNRKDNMHQHMRNAHCKSKSIDN